MSNVAFKACKSGGECSTGAMGSDTGRWTTTGWARMAGAMLTIGIASQSSGNELPGSNGIRLHCLTVLVSCFDCLLHWPDLQQSFWTPGNMKNWGQATHPPHSRVATIRPASSELATVRSTSSNSMLPRGRSLKGRPGGAGRESRCQFYAPRHFRFELKSPIHRT